LDFDGANWFANVLDFAIYSVEMSLLSTKVCHLGLELLYYQGREPTHPSPWDLVDVTSGKKWVCLQKECANIAEVAVTLG
jgi:hypothetical protein